ncbi:helix-turn-helix domain-containing protein [Kibdelosporangium philippinense]|uniref:Helix-turn-helix domain-containing protein n=1 Tax=Kibdelosporangium philippinense TaxID=211113 RepID=A0ABS8ZJT1_9PSEU|nr:helix-turn-helix domain-containing protein [Kibdelosporangium philippinense]MCE7006723.1 helix-turn-helix domain-containing protein [Kibdelosporangium philippinense]
MTTRREATAEPLWTSADLATFLQVSEATLKDWRHKGTGPAYKRMGKHVRYVRTAVEAWLEEIDRDNAA